MHHVTKVPMACSLLSLGLVCALLLGAMVVVWQDETARQTEQRVSTQRSLLKRLVTLERQLEMMSRQNITGHASMAIGTTEAAILFPEALPTSWNTDEATSTTEYRNVKKGIAFQVPYDASWGDGVHRVVPSEVDSDEKISFGPLVYLCGEGCGWNRLYQVMILPARTETQAITEFKNYDVIGEPKIIHRSISGFPILDLKGSSAFGSVERIEFSGKKYNYLLTKRPGMQAPEDKIIQGILKTLHSI